MPSGLTHFGGIKPVSWKLRRYAFLSPCSLLINLSRLIRFTAICLFIVMVPAETNAAVPAYGITSDWDLAPVIISQSTPLQSRGAPPPPAPVPENASRVTATVRKYSMWAAGSLKNSKPLLPSDQLLYSIVLEIQASHPAKSNLESLARSGTSVEAFFSKRLEEDLVGKKIEATLILTGDTYGVRWWVSDIRVVP